MMFSLIRLSELGVFYINDVIVDTNNNPLNPSFQALSYRQTINRAAGPPKKGKSPKIFDIIIEQALDCIYAAKNFTSVCNNNIIRSLPSALDLITNDIVTNTITTKPVITKPQRFISHKKSKKEFVYTEKARKIRHERVIKKSDCKFAWIQHFKKDQSDHNNCTLVECSGCNINFKKTVIDSYRCVFKVPFEQVRVLDIKNKTRISNDGLTITTTSPIFEQSKQYTNSSPTGQMGETMMNDSIVISPPDIELIRQNIENLETRESLINLHCEMKQLMDSKLEGHTELNPFICFSDGSLIKEDDFTSAKMGFG